MVTCCPFRRHTCLCTLCDSVKQDLRANPVGWTQTLHLLSFIYFFSTCSLAVVCISQGLRRCLLSAQDENIFAQGNEPTNPVFPLTAPSFFTECDDKPIIWIRCVGAGKHLKLAGRPAPRNRGEKCCFFFFFFPGLLFPNSQHFKKDRSFPSVLHIIKR